MPFGSFTVIELTVLGLSVETEVATYVICASAVAQVSAATSSTKQADTGRIRFIRRLMIL